MNDITLDRVRSSEQFDFSQLFDALSEASENDSSSLFQSECKYYSTNDFKDLSNTNDWSDSSVISSFALNCRSLTYHWNEVYSLIANLSSETFSFDCIGLCEIFNLKSTMPYKLEGYHKMESHTRDGNDDGRGGVGLFIKEEISYNPRDDISVFIPHIIETLFVELESTKPKGTIVGVIYRPNTYPKADIDVFIETLRDILNIINKENKNIILMGDINIDLLNFQTNDKTNMYLNSLTSNGLLPVITRPTRLTTHSATLIDHVVTNKIDNYCSGIILTDISDHFGVFGLFRMNAIKSKPKLVSKRMINERNIQAFINILSHTDYTTVFNSEDANTAYDKFLELFHQAFETSFPKKVTTFRKRHTKQQPWFTQGLLNSSKTKNKLFKKKIQKPTETNINKYKTYCNIYNKTCRQSKKKYYSELFDQCKNDMKKCWTNINTMIKKSKSTHSLPSYFMDNDTKITDNAAIAQGFNKFFSTIGENLNKSVDNINITFNYYLSNPQMSSFFFQPITIYDVFDIVNKLKKKSSYGFDEISINLIKAVIHCIAEPLTYIFNSSLQSGIVPIKLKIAKVIPVFKSGDKNVFTNYRPISLLPSFSKIIEKIVFNQVYNYIITKDILYKHQYGFRPRHSTIHPIMHFLKHIAQQNDKSSKYATVGIFIDLKKAFDTLSHPILLQKLEYYGIRGLPNDWFKDYLNDRCQFTEVNGSFSPSLTITTGVPQGSILGPLLFLIYINDISSSTKLNILSFADDTTAYHSGQNLTEMSNTINDELKNVYNWCCANKLILNTSKTKYMIFAPAQSKLEYNNVHLQLGTEILERVGNNQRNQSIKFLGITFDEHLTWKYHINAQCSKIAKAVFALSQIKHFLPSKVLKTIYFALVHSQLSFGLLAWGKSIHSHRLNKLQKQAVRIINKSKYRAHTEPLFKKDNILKMDNLYTLQAALFIFDYKHNKLPQSFNDFFPAPPSTSRITRRPNDLYITRPRTNYTSNLPFYSVPQTFNSLNEDFKSVQSRKLKTYMINSYSDHIRCNNRQCLDCFG